MTKARPYLSIMDARDRLPALHAPIALNADDTKRMDAALARGDTAEASAIGKRAGYRGGCRCAECTAAHEHAQRADSEPDDERAAIKRMHENYRNPRRP